MHSTVVLPLEVCDLSWILWFDHNSILEVSFIALAAELMYSGSYWQKFVSMNIQILRGKDTMGTFF